MPEVPFPLIRVSVEASDARIVSLAVLTLAAWFFHGISSGLAKLCILWPRVSPVSIL